MREDAITSRILARAIRVHKILGPGLLESSYRRRTKKGYRIDFLVEESVVVEVKAARQIALLDHAQVQTYLKLMHVRVGLILNFNSQWMKNGIARIVNPAFLL